ncbi:MAG: hypothetical protein ACRDB0_07045 [Paraclostridium sp.]
MITTLELPKPPKLNVNIEKDCSLCDVNIKKKQFEHNRVSVKSDMILLLQERILLDKDTPNEVKMDVARIMKDMLVL